jgi:hypothetical protein
MNKLFIEQKKKIQFSPLIDTKVKMAVVALFVDYWDDNDVLPIYVFQSSSAYGRYSQHKREVKKILEGKSTLDDHEKVIYQRIADFIKCHDLTVNDIKGVVLEEYDDKLYLEDAEDNWTQLLKADIFGFNRSMTVHYLRKLESRVLHNGHDEESFTLKRYLQKAYKFGINLMLSYEDYSLRKEKFGFYLENIKEMFNTDLFDYSENYVTMTEALNFSKMLYLETKKHYEEILSGYFVFF